MKVLLVGDMHVTVEELADAQALINGVLALVDEQKPDCVIFLGDQHHNHALVRVEVTDFWLKNLARFPTKPIMILGNHDRPNDASTSAHALQPYRNLAVVVEKPTFTGGVWLLPYYHDREKMIAEVSALPDKKVAVCHQTFDGSKYENGFFAPDGVDPAALGFPFVVSGHIHSMQRIQWSGGTVHYVGSPRWRTLSDANVPKCVVMWDTQSNDMTLFDTSKWCSPISASAVDETTELETLPFSGHPNARHHFDAIATKAAMDELVGKLRGRFPGCKVRPFPTDKVSTANKVSETEGVFNALRRFISSYKPPHGTDLAHLQNMIAQRLNVNS